VSNFWNNLLALNDELSIWIEQDELGKKKVIHYKGKRCLVNIPDAIDKKITLRLRGLGRKRIFKTGDLLLHVWLNKPEDVRTNLWLSETAAKNGGNKRLCTEKENITVVIPPKSNNGTTLRLRGLGKSSPDSPRLPVLGQPRRGDLLVKLRVYPDSITPKYTPFDTLSMNTMVLEGWVYRKHDEVMSKIGKSSLPTNPIQASVIADLFNTGGYTSIFDAIVEHLRLKPYKIELSVSASILSPGVCQVNSFLKGDKVCYSYKITLQERFLDNPFAISAIIAHELCHIVQFEKVDTRQKSVGFTLKTKEAMLEEERTVDLLVFMFKLGEFQLRVARDKRLTIGYFDQEVFERMQVIVLRKHSSLNRQ
jgi:hypothetical protein